MSDGGDVIKFIEKYCRVPEGKYVGKPLKLMKFQKEFIHGIYDNPAGTSRAYLSIARKNGKSATIAALALAHLVGPRAQQNSQIISGARSRDQAALVYKLAEKMVGLNEHLRKLIKPIPSLKTLIGLPMNVEFRAISAEAGTAHGLSPVVAILDEVGQVKGPYDAFVEAMETAQGAHEKPVLLAISTQATTADDLFSRWLDDAKTSGDPRIVSQVHAAPEGCDLLDRVAWKEANPALGVFRSLQDMEDFAERASRDPTSENTFRWLYLNQRVEAFSEFVSRDMWEACNAPVQEFSKDLPVYAGLDLSEVNDLTALVLIGRIDGVWHVKPTFWLPGDGLAEKSRKDRNPYDVWHKQGHLLAAPGRSVDYEYVAEYLRGVFDQYNVQKLAFDRWNMRHLKPWLLKAGFSETFLEQHFVEFGQGSKSMSPALRDLKAEILNGRLAHGDHPVLKMCAANAVVEGKDSSNQRLSKNKSSGRIDGMTALAEAFGVAPLETTRDPEYQMIVLG